MLAYAGVTQSATNVSLQSDLSNAATALKTFAVENNSNYPSSISTDCNTTPTTTTPPTNLCLKLSPGNNYIGYSANNNPSSGSRSFLLIASNKTTTSPGAISYKVTDTTSPTQLATTNQPNTTPGAVLELHAGKANQGLSQGINSPLTTTWKDTSGNGNDGTLTNFGGTTASGWGGSGASGDPWKLTFDGVDDYVGVADNAGVRPGTGDFTAELWLTIPYSQSAGSSGLLTKGLTTSAPAGTWGLWAGNPGTTTVVYRDVLTAGTWTGAVYLETTCPTGWNHVVLTRSAGTYRMYRAGNLASGPTTPATTPNLDSTAVITLMNAGSRYTGTATPIARIYPFALTASQVSVNYAAGPTW